MILAFDTSSALTSVALVDRGGVKAERSELDARRHAEVLSPLLAETIAGVEPGAVHAIACGVGPGPYTGLRVGIATALAVGAAWDVPVHGLCSLDAIASAVVALVAGDDIPDGFCVGADARRHEVYWARYSRHGDRLDGPRVGRPDDIDGSLRVGPWAGHGAAAHAAAFGPRVGGADPTAGTGYARAGWVGLRVQALLDAGVAVGEATLRLDRHGEDSGATSRAIQGTVLLPPRPLYLRRPDAVEGGGRA